jgi:hypothetical protein
LLTGKLQARQAMNQSLPSLLRLALCGDTGCGKDTWLATLPLACEKSALSLRPFDEATAAWQVNTWARIARGYFPHPTPIPHTIDALKPLTFALATNGASGWLRRRQTLLLQILQMTGCWWTNALNTPQLQPNASDPYHDLAYAAGIIYLLDPTASDCVGSAVTFMTMLDALDMYRRRYKRNRSIRIALWLTKMDHSHHLRYKAHAEAHARHLFGPYLSSYLSRYSKSGGYEFRWGGCSAVGTIMHQGRIRSNSYWDYSACNPYGNPQPAQRLLDPQSLQPENVLEPLCWVIAPRQ